MALVGDIPVEISAVVVDDAPTVAALRREGDPDDFCAVFRELTHLLVALVGDIPVEVSTFVVNNAPAIASLRRERNADDFCAIFRELTHLLVALVGVAAAEIGAIFGDNAPMVISGAKRHTDRLVSRRREIFYLLVTLVRDVPVKENCHAIAILRGNGDVRGGFVTVCEKKPTAAPSRSRFFCLRCRH